jgi:hypothetical protein
MLSYTLAGILGAILVLWLLLAAFIRWGTRWGSTPEERAAEMPGDAYLEGGPPARVAMTRAISIRATPVTVWVWLAQVGRGAGFYSIDRLDNGGKTSARHIVSWIPAPRRGDATAIGYLRHIAPGRELTWWTTGSRFLGAWARLAVDIRLTPEGDGARLLTRMSADAAGVLARPVLWAFQVIDTIMARRQLLVIKSRVETYGARFENPEQPETGARDQYQLYEVIYASGETAGVKGKELAARWHRAAVEDGVM